MLSSGSGGRGLSWFGEQAQQDRVGVESFAAPGGDEAVVGNLQPLCGVAFHEVFESAGGGRSGLRDRCAVGPAELEISVDPVDLIAVVVDQGVVEAARLGPGWRCR